MLRHSPFLIYHHDDYDAVEAFVTQFGSLFDRVHTRGVTEGDDFVASPSDEFIVRCIRDRYLRDATMAIVFLGEATWTRRFVDWEIAASIGLHGDAPLPLLGLELTPSPVVPARLRHVPLPRVSRGRLAAYAGPLTESIERSAAVPVTQDVVRLLRTDLR